MSLIVVFWVFVAVILYAYGGYTLLLAVIAWFKKDTPHNSRQKIYEPEVTLLIPAYNEAESIESKMKNSLELDYPEDKLKIAWITDGSDDGSEIILRQYKSISILHKPERRGKIHAMNRGMKQITSPVVVFTDANTMLNRNAIREMVKYFEDDHVGCVAGEKRIENNNLEKAVEAGEGLYWQYESQVKRIESQSGSAVGAVGELFAVRADLYKEVREDTILDDFVISLQIAEAGYSIKYAPGAWCSETASVSVQEELKRKIRIACGGWQTLFRMPGLLNPFKHGFLSFKYISHKVLRWTLVPVAFLVVLLLNILIVKGTPFISSLYWYLLVLQLFFYLVVLIGAIFNNVRTRAKFLFAPYYLFVMNYAIVAGMIRYFSGNYSVKWEKAKRS